MLTYKVTPDWRDYRLKSQRSLVDNNLAKNLEEGFQSYTIIATWKLQRTVAQPYWREWRLDRVTGAVPCLHRRTISDTRLPSILGP